MYAACQQNIELLFLSSSDIGRFSLTRN